MRWSCGGWVEVGGGGAFEGPAGDGVGDADPAQVAGGLQDGSRGRAELVWGGVAWWWVEAVDELGSAGQDLGDLSALFGVAGLRGGREGLPQPGVFRVLCRGEVGVGEPLGHLDLDRILEQFADGAGPGGGLLGGRSCQ